jgi:hypothetical protein
MRRQHNLVFCVSLVFLTAALSPGGRAQTLELQCMMDCEGWGAVANLEFPDGVFEAQLDYSVVLNLPDGTEVARFENSEHLFRLEDPFMSLLYDGGWPQALDGQYQVVWDFHFLGEVASQTLDLSCGDGPAPEPCHHPYRYWRRHPEEWPLLALPIGDRIFTRDELLRYHHRWLHTSQVSGLMRQVVAARLNLAAGCDDSIAGVLEQADELLAGAFAGTVRRAQVASRNYKVLRRELRAYNNLPCGDGFLRNFDQHMVFGVDPGDKALQEEKMSFSALKAMYR